MPTQEKILMHALLKKLAGTDRRSIGKSNEVATEVLADPSLFGVVFDGMLDADPVLRMRCADAIEKISAEHPEYLRPYKKRLLEQVAKIDQQEVSWHVAQLFSRLKWSPKERRVIVDILKHYLADDSKIVKTFAMQALADIAAQDAGLRPAIIKQLKSLARTGSPAMKARGKKLLAKLKTK
jgi:hypothetical protein